MRLNTLVVVSTFDTVLIIGCFILICTFLFSPEILSYIINKKYLTRFKYYVFPSSRQRYLEKNERDMYLIKHVFDQIESDPEPRYSRTILMSDGLTVTLSVTRKRRYITPNPFKDTYYTIRTIEY